MFGENSGRDWCSLAVLYREKMCQREEDRCVWENTAGVLGKMMPCDSVQCVFMFTKSVMNFQLRNKLFYKM